MGVRGKGDTEQVPEVLALTEPEGVALLAGTAKKARVVVTKPPWPGRANGRVRVVRQRVLAEGLVELTVASERFQRRGPDDHV